MDYAEPGSVRLADFVKDSLARTGDQVRESTRRETESAMKDFIGTIGDIDFQSVRLARGEQYLQICPDRNNTKETWEWLVKDADHRTLPLTEEIVQMLVYHRAQQPEGYPYVFVRTARYDCVQEVLRQRGKWILTDSRLKVVNDFRRQFDKILKRASVKKGTFHDFRRTAISMWFANGMSEHDVMLLAGHASFATTHEFYLAVAGDLIHRARTATAEGLRQKLVHFGADAFRT